LVGATNDGSGNRIARIPDESEIVTTKEEGETRIRNLKEKARIE
jgi:hypothetical protein